MAALAVIVFIVLGIFASQRAAALETAEEERRRADGLLEAILPSSIAKRLKGGETRIAEQHEATVLFADVVGFTTLAARLAADELVELLDGLFRDFDELVERHDGVIKIKTIGDSYMVAVGAPLMRHDHAQVAAGFALQLVDVAARAQVPGASNESRGPSLGRQRPVFDLWGDTVNIASRLESQGVPGRIQISEITHDLLGGDYECEARGFVDVRGRGRMRTWFLVGPREAGTDA
ncbi:MAG: adenylate/guanylate cyclase domain-containing protein [Chloroflexota bacterium]|nr:adenylate/guanylate cyclase domain-containing protein [Chloroflexota bacterium]